jgi:LacI family transcriptional regulator
MRANKQHITIREVAQAAGVSIQTVSNVMHNKPSVHPEIQARVQEAIEQLGYYPSRNAQGLRQRASHTLGFLVFDPNPRALADPVHGEVIAGMNDVARANKYSLLVDTPAILHDTPVEHFIRPFRTNRIDAAVITLSGTTDVHEAVIADLVEANVVFALLERRVSGGQAFCLLSANYAGAYDATSLLIERGRTQIAFIDSVQMWPAVDQRLQGYIDAMREHGLEANVRVVSSPDWTVEGGAAATRRLVDNPEHPRPDAILGGNDLLAVGAIHTVRINGLHVPDEVAIMGFDDFELARYVEPALSTVRVPYYEMGHQAATLLIDHLQGQPAAEHCVVLPTEIILRQSI